MTAGSDKSPVFDFTSLDFESLEQDLIRYAQSRFPEEKWTDFNPSNEGTRLVELISYAGDLLAYSENAHALETIVASQIREKNFRASAKTYDYAPPSKTPSRTVLRFTLDAAFLPVTIPSTFKVSDGGTVIFQPNATGTATTTTYEVEATQGEEISDEELAVSDGNPNQAYELGVADLLDGTLSVSVGGTPYRMITNFIEASPTDEVYVIETDEDGVTKVIFGDNINGKVPPIGQVITATYKVGGGEEGNLPVDTITTLVDSLPGVLSVTNIVAAENGGPKPSLTTMKRSLALSLKANHRAVTVEDYATFAASLVPGVLKATAVHGRYYAGGSPIILFIVPQGGGELSNALSNVIVTTLRYGTGVEGGVSMAGRRIYARTAYYVYMQIEVEAHVQRGYSAVAAKDRVRRAFLTHYSLESSRFGDAVSEQDAYNIVDPVERKIDGLARVFLRRFTIKPHYNRYVNNPTTGNGEVVGITVGPAVLRREWCIQFIVSQSSVPEYVVKQRILGRISFVSSTSIEDEEASYIDEEFVDPNNPWYLHVREQEQEELFRIVGNSQSSVTVATPSTPGGVPGLLLLSQPGDTYAIERQESVVGKVIRTTVADAANSGGFTVQLSSVSGFAQGDWVAFVKDGDHQAVRIASIAGNVLTLASPLKFDLEIGDTCDWCWHSDDDDVAFAVVAGTSAWVPGDTLYVDVYPRSGDIKLRPENFPILEEEDLLVTTVGGVR